MRKAQLWKEKFLYTGAKCYLLLIALVPILSFVTALSLLPGIAWASDKPASTQTLLAGSYIIDVNLYQDPPVAD